MGYDCKKEWRCHHYGGYEDAKDRQFAICEYCSSFRNNPKALTKTYQNTKKYKQSDLSQSTLQLRQ